MSSEDKEAMGLAGHLRVAASSFTTLLRTQTQRAAIDVALLAIRELCWDDHNECEGRGAGRVLCVWVTQEQIQATTKLLGVKAAYVCALICRFFIFNGYCCKCTVAGETIAIFAHPLTTYHIVEYT